MKKINTFQKVMERDYSFEGPSFVLGGAMLYGTCLTGNLVSIPLRSMNRQGLIAGATGTGKTKTSMSEQILDTMTKRQIDRTIARELTRGLMGILGAR